MLNAIGQALFDPTFGVKEPAKKYELSLEKTDPTTTAKVSNLEIGKLFINQLNGDSSTQSLRDTSTKVAAGGVVASVGTVVATTAAILNPAFTLGVAITTAIATGAAAYLNFVKVDLQSPKEREETVKEVAKMSLSQIAENFSEEQVIGYHLLEHKLTSSTEGNFSSDPKKLEFLYTCFRQHSRDIQHFKDQAEAHKKTVHDEFNLNGGYLATQIGLSNKTPDMSPSSEQYSWMQWSRVKQWTEIVNPQQVLLTKWVDWKEEANKTIDKTLDKNIDSANKKFSHKIAALNATADSPVKKLEEGDVINLEEEQIIIPELPESGWNLL